MAASKTAHCAHRSMLQQSGERKRVIEYRKGDIVFAQGDPADAVFFVRDGKIKLTTTSDRGKEAVVATVSAGGFVGEGCLAGQPFRMTTAAAAADSLCIRIEKEAMTQLLHRRGEFSERFMWYLLGRNIRIEADLVDQLFNSSEKRLARTLLLLARFGKEGAPQTVVPWVSQEALAEIVGTTKSRVSHFINKFRRLGFIEYTDEHNGGLSVHSSLLNVILYDKTPKATPLTSPLAPRRH